MWSASSGGFRRGWLRDGYRAELLPAAPLHRHACSLAAAAAPQTRPATCPRRAPLRRRRHVSRLCEPPGDTARLQVLFQRFLQLRDVFSLDDFLSGWRVCGLLLAGSVGWGGVGSHRGAGLACCTARLGPNRLPAGPARLPQVPGRAAQRHPARQLGGLCFLRLLLQGAPETAARAQPGPPFHGCTCTAACAARAPPPPRGPLVAASYSRRGRHLPVRHPPSQLLCELAEQEQDTVRRFVDDVEAAWGVRFAPGFDPTLQYMAHLWEPLR